MVLYDIYYQLLIRESNMKAIVACIECLKSAMRTGNYLTDYYDNKKTVLVCQHGHKTNIYIRNEKFEILYASSVYAYYSGFYNECVSTAMASLERLYEFLSNVFYSKLFMGGGQIGISQSFEINFKRHLKKFSERQFGAFTVLFSLATHGEVYDHKRRDGDRGIVAIRNRIIHQGVMTDPTEAKNFLKLVFDEINSILKVCSTDAEIREAIDLVRNDIQSKAIADGGWYTNSKAICINFLESIEKKDNLPATFLNEFEEEYGNLIDRFRMISSAKSLN